MAVLQWKQGLLCETDAYYMNLEWELNLEY